MGDWERAQLPQSGRLLPSVIFITEAYKFCPDTNAHSIFHELPNMAQQVRKTVAQSLNGQGKYGQHWYLATRKITGMDPEVLRQCSLWMVHRPLVPEVQSGWVSAYTGVDPQNLQSIPPTHTLILDLATREPQLIAFRDSHSQGNGQQSTSTFTLHSIPSLPQTSPLSTGETIPFANR